MGWKYDRRTLSAVLDLSELDALGAEGWELVTVIPWVHTSELNPSVRTFYTHIFKREEPGEEAGDELA